jgi:hypothetical protein
MSAIRMEKNKILDGQRIFRMYYTDLGSARSIVKVRKQLGNDAINPRTGRHVTNMAIWFSMYRWAYENLDLSYQIFMDAMRDEGKFHTREEWETFVSHKAHVIVKQSEKKFQRWQNRVANQTKSVKMTPA